MTQYEGILVTRNDHVNVSAAGVRVQEDKIKLRIYHPSDTARNLDSSGLFTFSMTDDPELFYKAALTGQNEPGYEELGEEELVEKDGYYFPKDSSITLFCSVLDIQKYKVKDKYGKSTLSLVTAEIQERKGEGPFIQRENPLVDAMVHATRLHVADEKQKKELKRKINKILEGVKNDISDRILKYTRDI